jgi:hypothetical protein
MPIRILKIRSDGSVNIAKSAMHDADKAVPRDRRLLVFSRLRPTQFTTKV